MKMDAIKRFKTFTGIPVGCMVIATEGSVGTVFDYYGKDNVLCPEFFATAVLDQDGYYINKASQKHVYICNNDGVIFFNIGKIHYMPEIVFDECFRYPAVNGAPTEVALPVSNVEIVDMHCGDDGEGIVLVKSLSGEHFLSKEDSIGTLSTHTLVKVTRLSKLASEIGDSVIRLDFSYGSYDVYIGHWNSGKIIKKEVSDGK